MVARDAECARIFAASGGAQRFHFLRSCRGGRIRWQRDCPHAVCGDFVLRNQNRRRGARSPRKIAGRGRRGDALQPRVHQHRHEHTHYARDGSALAPAQLWRVVRALLVDRAGHFAKCLHLSKVLLIMNDNRNFSRRRRGAMRFRPSGGMNPNANVRSERAATEARAEVIGGEKSLEGVYDKLRHEQEIERAENLAAGLPPETDRPEKQPADGPPPRKRDFRQPHLETPAVVQEQNYEPVEIKPPPSQGIVESIKSAATKVIRKVQRLIKPVKKTLKEIIINAESLETRVAVLEEGKLEEFTIERTTEERLVGSIFKGKVRNLEDGLKAAFVDIGFEKNAFLHYWDIVPTNLDSGVEVVERED